MKNGQRIVFEGESDEKPDLKAGDIVFQLEEQPHDLFERDGIHLYMTKKISFLEALTGFEFKIPHFGKRTLLVTCTDPISPFQVKQISNQGMPTYKSPFDKGNLYINFEVKYPKKEKLKEIMKILLDIKEEIELKEGEKMIKLEKCEIDIEIKRNNKGEKEVVNNDLNKSEEKEQRGPREGVSCQTN